MKRKIKIAFLLEVNQFNLLLVNEGRGVGRDFRLDLFRSLEQNFESLLRHR